MPNIQQLKKEINQSPNLKDKLKVLQNSCQERTCVVISCGPSLSNIDKTVLKDRLAGKIVIAVKQAYKIFKHETDFHLYNYINYENYRYSSGKNPITIELNNTRKIVSPQSDIRLPIDFAAAVSPRRYEMSLAKNKNFNKYLMTNTPTRPFGPGIFYEMAGYFAVHLGVKEMITIGFDCADPSKHYYGEQKVDPDRLQTLQKEMDVVVEAMPDFYQWLKSKGVSWKIISDINPAPDLIPRLMVEDL